MKAIRIQTKSQAVPSYEKARKQGRKQPRKQGRKEGSNRVLV